MNYFLSSLFKILFSLFYFSYLQCKSCPSITTHYNTRNDLGYTIRSFSQIPFTNILIVNTILKVTENSSIVYYIDMQTRDGDIINVVQPDYPIIQMSYIYSQGKLLAVNYDRMIVANPYTLKSYGYIYLPQLIDSYMIGYTDYAVAILKYYVIYIIDINLMEVVKTLDSNGFPNALNTYNFYSKSFNLITMKSTQYIIITVNSYGFYSWTIDLFDFNATYNGYIPVTTVNNTDYANRKFVKHPSKDIFFIGGVNLEIIAFEIVNITTQTYRTQIKLNMYNSAYKLNITNLVFKSNSNFTSLELSVVDGIYIYDVLLKYHDSNNSYSIPNSKSFSYIKEYQTYYTWFEMNGGDLDFRMILNGGYFITIYNTLLRNPIYSLFIGSDFFSRRFIYEGQESFFVFPRSRSIQYYSKNYIGVQLSFNSNMTYNPFQEENSYYIVKNCEECLFIKTSDPNTTYSHFMNIIVMYPRVNNLNKTLNITSLGYKWSEVNVNLDPFYYKNQTWVVFGFRNKPADKKFLFLLINMYDTTKNVILTGASDEENCRQSSYALESIDDPDNLEIIGVDLLGFIYVWDFLSPKVIKYSRKTSCLNSDIGVMYQYNKKKWIIFACDNRFVLSYDFQKNTTQFISQVTKNPQSMKTYPRLGIIAVGDTITGNVYIHKFTDDSFTYFLTIQPGNFKDNMISFELLKDNSMWVQYSYSNFFFPLGECIDDVKNCLKCEQNYYFNTSMLFNNQTIYGNGTNIYPYTSAYNFLTAMLRAQRYQERIYGVTSMKVNIIVDPQNIINIPKGFLNFDFSSIISLSIKSRIENQLATLEYSDKLEFANYNYINFQDIRILFILSNFQNECGLNFINIYQNVTLSNIELLIKNQTNVKLNCFQIHFDQTNVQILKLSIQNQDFSSHKSIFSTLYTDWIDIKNLSLNNCIFGEDFSILSQNSNLLATIHSVNITNNYCVKNQTQHVSSLFSAGLFYVQNILISDNYFCNKIIFSSVTSLTHKNYWFQFKQIQILNNIFTAKTSYLFFNSIYSMNQQPSHSATFSQMSIQNNTIQKKIEDDDLQNAFLIQTNKIASHTFEDIVFKNHYQIAFSLIEYSNSVQINKFNCINDKLFLESSPDSDSGSCFKLYEIQYTYIQKIKVNYKKAYNNELISLQNKLFFSLSQIDISDGEFSNMILMQKTINSFASPITVLSQNSLNLTILNCHFFENSLEVVKSSQTFSTSALYVDYLLGQVNIIESSFKNSTSNSIYNFIFIQTIQLKLYNLIFNNSSFGSNLTKQLGGFINLIISTLKIVESQFIKSNSQYGSFIYMQTLSNVLIVDIIKTNFSEGYAEVEGGALFIDIKKSQLKLTCTDCLFSNIYSQSPGSSVIGFQKYRITIVDLIHEMIFQGGHIQKIYGVGDNFFSDIFNMKLSLIDIKDINSLITQSDVLDFQINEKFKNIVFQQSTLVSSQFSEIIIKGCIIKNLSILNETSNMPLLINSIFTPVSITDTIIQDGIFVNSAIKIINGTLTLQKTQFKNIVQQQRQNSRYLLDSDKNSDNSISSLIIIKDSNLKVSEETSFIGTKCFNSCTGSVFYLMNTNFDISNMNISNSEATFGGSLFIQGLKQYNQIISCKFINNTSQIHGGAIYLQALNEDRFQLKIENSMIFQNQAISGKGGGLFIRSNSLNSTNQLIQIYDTQIIGNIAQIGGGIYQKEISLNFLGNTVLKENMGRVFGHDVFSYPTHLRLTSINQFINTFDAKIIGNDRIVVQNFRSGDTLKNLSFELVNDQDEVIWPIPAQELQDCFVQVQVGKNQHFQNYSIRGNVSASYDSQNNKQFVFQEFDLIGIPGSEVTLEFFSDSIYVLDKNQLNQYNQNYSFKIIINFRNCIQGEAISTYSSLTECIVCQEGKFSFDLQECHTCPTGATCGGSTLLIANQGYWRNNNESSLLISCSQEENCIGGSFGDHICFEGHIGAICEECDINGEYWKNSYSKSGKYSCTNCNEITYNFWIILLLAVWTLFSMFLAIRRKEKVKHVKIKNQTPIQFNLLSNSCSTPQNQKHARILSIFGRQVSSRYNGLNNQKSGNEEGQKSSIFIKILTNYFQIVSSLSTFNLTIPSFIFTFPQFAGQPLDTSFKSLDCILKDYNTSIPFIYFRLIVALIIPIIYFFIFFLGLGILQISKRKRKFPFNTLSTATIFLIIYFQPGLVFLMIGLTSCRLIGDTNYILSNVSYLCYTRQHSQYVLFFIAPALTIWVFAFPLLLFCVLYKNRNNLSKIKVKMTYGFLYREYKREAYYWEFIKMAEKIFIIFTLNFYSTTINVKAFLVFAIILTYGILSLIIRPYKQYQINKLDNYSTIACGISVLLGVFINQNPFPYFIFISFGIIFIINFMFIYTILKKIINVYIQKVKEVLLKIMRKLSEKIPKFRIWFKQKEENKKINPVVKEKVKRIFENYIRMSVEEKQKIKIRNLKCSFELTLSNMFGDYYDTEQDFNDTEEQNNLQTKNQNQITLFSSQITSINRINDNKIKQQKRNHNRLSIFSPVNNDQKSEDKLIDSEQHNIFTEDSEGDSSSRSLYQRNKQLSSFYFQKANENLIQAREVQNNQYISLNYPLLFVSDRKQPIILNEDEIKTNNELNEDKLSKRETMEFQRECDTILKNEICGQQDEKESSGIEFEISNIDVNSNESKETNFLYLLNYQLENQDEIVVKDEGLNIDDSQIEEQNKNEDISQNELHNNNEMPIQTNHNYDIVNED